MFCKASPFAVRSFLSITLALFINNSFVAASQNSSDDTRGLKPREYAERLQQQVVKKRPRSTQAKKPSRTKYVATTKDIAPVAEGVDVGVTFWRLRAARKSDAQSLREIRRKVVRVKNKEVEKTVTQVPTRAESETLFADGDSLRLSIEVPYQAYIYVFNREQYRDGTLSEPYLVYPGTTDVKRTEPGRLVYIPNEPSSLEITPTSASLEKVAEVFVVLLSPQPIKELPPLKDEEENRTVDGQQFERWEKEWSARVWKSERQGGVGASITNVEKSAGKASGTALTETDPQPQTIYHVARQSSEVVWFTIPIKIRK